MTDDTAGYAYPILEHGLRVRAGLARGQTYAFEREHARLKELLLAPTAAAGVAGPVPTGKIATPGFLGIRYGLACWADELFITGTPWQSQWNERKLEVELYGSNDRAWKFWDQARFAEQQPADDALEVFFLCVQLGFRGTMLEDPAKLKDWLATVRDRLRELPVEESPYDLLPDPPFEAAPRYGGANFQRMLSVGAVVVLAAAPLIAFLVVSELGGR